MIRIAPVAAIALAAFALAAASPALALEHTSVPAPKAEGPRFLNFGRVAKLMPDTAAEPMRFDGEQQPKSGTVIYDVSKGQTKAWVDVTDPRENPFMAQPERKAAPAR